MAGDFGDESGQGLLDNFVRFGEMAGVEAMRERAYAVRRACDHARAGALAEAGKQDVPWAEPREWAKLDMGEFQEIEGYEGIRAIIEGEMSARGVEARWFREEGSSKDYLLFRIKDAREVWEGFGALSREAGDACEKAAEAVARAAEERADGRGEDRGDGARRGARRGAHAKTFAQKHGLPDARSALPWDARPLEERAEHARAASAALEGERAAMRERARGPRMQEARSK